MVVNLGAPARTMRAARVLSEELEHVLPPQYTPVLLPSNDDLGLPPIDPDAASTRVSRDHSLIVVVVGPKPMPWHKERTSAKANKRR